MKMKTKKLTCTALAVSCVAALGAAAIGLLPTSVNAEVAADPAGMRIAMTDDWKTSSSNGTLTVKFDETTFATNDYFAIDMRTYEATLNGASNQYCPQIQFDGAAKSTTTFTVGNRWGDNFNVDYKNGGYIYLPASMYGVVYVPASLFVTESDTSLSSITLNWSNHGRTMTANYYSFFKASEIGEQMTAENVIFNFDALKTDANGAVTDENVTYSNVDVTRLVSAVGFKTETVKEFTVTTPTDTLADTYFTASFAETAFSSGEYLAIDLKVKSKTISGGASDNYAFQIKLNGATMQHPVGVYKQTFGAEFGAYQRGGSGVGYFGNGVWFFMNADVDAILYIPADKLLAGTSSANAVKQTALSSVTIDYAGGNVGRQTTVIYNSIFKAAAIGETMNESNCLYDFTNVQTNASGAVEDSTLTVARLTAALSTTEKTDFVADMTATALAKDETYAKEAGEKTVEVAVSNGAIGNAETLAVRFKQTERTLDGEGLTAKIGLKFKNYASTYSFGDVKSVPAIVDGAVSNLAITDGKIALAAGSDTTVYLPLSGVYQAIPKDANLEKIVIDYTGNDFAVGGFALRKDVNGEKVNKALNVTLTASENVSIVRYAATVSETENGAIAFDKAKYAENETAVLTVAPESGWQLHTLTVNGVDVTASVVNGKYEVAATEDLTATASFMPAITNETFYYDGASIRVHKAVDETGDGIRFTVLLEKELYERLTAFGEVQFGTVLLPTDLVPENEELTVETPLAKVENTAEVLTEVEVEGKTYMRSIVYVWGIPEKNYSRGIEARGYIVVNGKYFYTAESDARSITYVAQKAYKAETDEEVRETCKSFFPVVTFDGGEGSGEMADVVLEDGTEYVLPECGFTAPEGKTFGGYSYNGKTYAVGDTIAVSGTVVVTIVWLS